MTAMHEVPRNPDQDIYSDVLECIKGVEIERSLLDLAKIGGTQIEGIPEQPERYAVSRLALSPIDIEAREIYVKPLMESAGMTVQEHPFGIIGTLTGEEPDLPPLVIFSHTDSVPRADMYDGVTGVIGGIKVVDAMTKSGITARRNIHVVALTGEESSAFGFALFGSRGMWHGLTERELQASIPGGLTIQDTLGEESTKIVKSPVVGEGGIIPTPYAVLELHVEQNDTLDKAGIDLGVVEAVAAPERYQIECGDTSLEVDTFEPPHATYLKLSVRGKSDHSGATPMGLENRADGLAETAKFLLGVLENESENSGVDVGSIAVDEQAINKIPGVTTTKIRVVGNSEADVIAKLQKLQEVMDQRNALLGQSSFRFGEEPITLEEIDSADAGNFFRRDEFYTRQKTALSVIANVNDVATSHASDKVVGTVGTYTVSDDGEITLGLDVRGIDKDSRNKAIEEIKTNAQLLPTLDAPIFGDSLPGSGDPVVLDAELVALAKGLIDEHKIGSSVVMFSAAGHDAQNAAKADHPTVMIFCQSNAGGIAHHPDAYTNPDNLEKGVKALAALTLKLVS